MRLKTLIISAALALTTAVAAQAEDKATSKILTEENKKFVKAFGPVEFADAYGDRAVGPQGTFGKFPGNFETPVHTHTYGYRAIVLKGEMTNPFDGQKDAPVMKPGSFWSVEGGHSHTTACVSATPCEFFMYTDKPFDFITPK